MTRTALYRHYDASGHLLYVGITEKLSVRNSQHIGLSSWFGNVAETRVEYTSCRRHAEALERVAIEFEKPVHNKAHAKPEIPKVARIAAVGSVDNKDILGRIEKFLCEYDMKPTTFGRHAVGDGNLVSQLKIGRDIQTKTRAKVLAFIRANEQPQ